MPGYEDQIAQDDPNGLRDAFAQLLMMGANKSYPLEALWAAQGRDQIPRPVPNPSGDGMPMAGAAPGLNFPTAPAGPQADREFQPEQAAKPFGGKGEVVGPYDPRAAAAPLPPSGGFTDTVQPTQPMPNAGASNMSIQPGNATKSAYHLPKREKKKKAED